MNQAAFGERMRQLRPTWSRSSVVKLENYNRESLSVADLLALARALNVPPIALIADPRHVSEVPVVEGESLPVWDALYWLIGRTREVSRYEMSADARDIEDLVVHALEVLSLCVKLDRPDEWEVDPESPPETDEDIERHERRERGRVRGWLRRLRHELNEIERLGAPAPPLPEYVLRLAREHEIQLPGKTQLPPVDG